LSFSQHGILPISGFSILNGGARKEERRVENEMEVKENSLLPHFNLANLLCGFQEKERC